METTLGAISDTAKAVYAAGPTTSPIEPDKSQIIALFQLVESILGSAVNGLVVGSAIVFQTRALLYAAAARPAGSLGIVYGDTTLANNGIYVTNGGTGSGAWALTNLILPSTVVADVSALLLTTTDLKARADQKLLPARELVIDGTKLLIPAMYYWVNGTNQFAAPTSAGADQNPAPIYWEVDIQADPSLVRFYYFSKDLAAANSYPIVIVDGGNAPQADTSGLILIAHSINGQVTTTLPIVGGNAGGTVKNIWPEGRYPAAGEWFFGDAVVVAAAGPLAAIGITSAVTHTDDTTVAYGLKFPAVTVGGEFVFGRIYIYQPTAAAVASAPTVALWMGGTFTANLFFSKERQITANLSAWVVRAFLSTPLVVDRALISVNQGAARDWQIAGGQFYIGNQYAGWIGRGDYPTSDPLSYRPAYGAHMWLISGRKQKLYLSNIIGSRGKDLPKLQGGFWSVRTVDANAPQVSEGYPQIDIDPDLVGPVGNIEVAIEQDLSAGFPDIRYQVPVATHIAAYRSSTATPKVLMMGDSLTNRKMVRCVDNKLRTLNIVTDWLGTINGADGTTDFYNDATGLPGEAREGFEFADFIGITVGRGDVTNNFPAYLAAPKVNKIGQLPFLRASTGGDPSDRVFNSLIFDLRYYLANTAQADPDIVVWGLITNDFATRDVATARANISNAVRVAFLQTRAALPSAKIAWWAPTYSVSNNGYRYSDHQSVIRAGVEAVRAIAATDANVHLIPVWAHQSPIMGYQLDPSTFADVNFTRRAGIFDPTHFNLGDAMLREQAAEQIAAYIANVAA